MHQQDPSAPLGSYCPKCLSREIAPGDDEVLCCKECGQRFVVRKSAAPPDLPPSIPINRHQRRRDAAFGRRRYR